MTANNNSPISDKPVMVLLIALGIAASAVGIIWVTTNILSDLDSNAKRLKELEVKKQWEGGTGPKQESLFLIADNTIAYDETHAESQKLYDSGEKLFQQGKYKLALQSFEASRKALDSEFGAKKREFFDDDAMSKKYRFISFCQFKLGRNEEALDNINTALKLRESSHYYLLRSGIYHKLGKEKLAIADEKMSHEATALSERQRLMMRDGIGDNARRVTSDREKN